MTSRDIFAALYELHYDEIHAFCARRVGRQAAGDVTAEVFTVVWRRREEIPAGVERAWIFGVARRLIQNQWRSSSRRDRLLQKVRWQRPSRVNDTEGSVAEGDRVRIALSLLRPDDQEILRLAAWDDLSGPEIAEVLDITLAATQQRLSRAKRRLATALTALDGASGDDSEVSP